MSKAKLRKVKHPLRIWFGWRLARELEPIIC